MMAFPTATVNSVIILLSLFLATSVINPAAAFTSQHSSLNSPREGIQPTAKNHRQLRTIEFRNIHRKEEHESTKFTPSSKPSALRAIPGKIFGTVEWDDLLYDNTSTAFEAWEWTNGMGAPAALVAAAVLVSLSETRLATSPRRNDKQWIRFTKQSMRFLLMSSFALELTSIFVANLTGALLLGHGPVTSAKKIVGYASPLQLLHHHHEFEYLVTQISFLQGLIHWLGAVACDLILPIPTETKSAKLMNKCLASWLVTMVFFIMSFYNDHINFYSDYVSMVRRLISLLLVRKARFRPTKLLSMPSLLVSIILTWRAFTSPPEED